MYTLHIVDPTSGMPLIDQVTARAGSVSMAWDKHGPADLTARLELSGRAAYALYDRPGTPRVIVAHHGGPIWVGRLERARVTRGAIDLTAGGYWRALGDLPYTGVFSTTMLKEWKVASPDLGTTYYTPERYGFNFNNRLGMNLKKNAAYGNAANVGGIYWVSPHRSRTQITRMGFTYDLKLPVNWQARFRRWTASGTTPFGAFGADHWTVTATGVQQTGTASATFAGGDTFAIDILNTTGATYTNTNEDENWYIKVTGMRLQSVTTAQVKITDVAADMVAQVVSTNPGHILGTGVLTPAALDLYDASYEDENPIDILVRLANDENYQIGIGNDRRLFLLPVGSYARDWAIDAANPEIERDMNAVYNQNYALYTQADGRTLRTASSTNVISQQRIGLTRAEAIDADTESATRATALSSARLSQSANPAPRTRVPVGRVMTVQGQAAPWHSIMPYDNVTIRNLPPTAATVDQIRSFRPARVQLDLEHGAPPELSLESETPLPAIDLLLAQVAGGRILL